MKIYDKQKYDDLIKIKVETSSNKDVFIYNDMKPHVF